MDAHFHKSWVLGIGVRRMQLDVDGIESLEWLAFDLGIRAFIAEMVVWRYHPGM